MADTPPSTVRPDDTPRFRQYLAAIIVGIATLGAVFLAYVTIDAAKDNKAGVAQNVLNSLLPLIGTWVGTVLAYYFSRENFEAAARSVVTAASTLTPDERLRSVAVRERMIPRERMFLRTLPATGIGLEQLKGDLAAAGKGERVPVLDENGAPALMVHLSRIDKFVAEALGRLAGDPAALANPAILKQATAKLTLADMLSATALKAELEGSWTTVAENATLADAKRAMESVRGCQDVFVTKTGARTEPVIGWITNVIIEENSRV
jgi:hypothetical protein